MTKTCHGCGKPVEVGDEDACDTANVIHEILLLEPDRWWHFGCYEIDYKARPHRNLSARERAALRWSA